MLTLFKTEDKDFTLMQSSWASEINPLLSNPISKGNLLKSISLISGNTTINHLLGRTLQGWVLTDQTAAATVYRSQPKNALTLTLTASAATTVDIYVF